MERPDFKAAANDGIGKNLSVYELLSEVVTWQIATSGGRPIVLREHLSLLLIVLKLVIIRRDPNTMPRRIAPMCGTER